MLAAAGCGFTPLHGPEAAATRARGLIVIQNVSGEMGFALRKRLTDRLGRAETASHRLGVRLDVDRQGLGISSQNEITRYTLTGTARYTLSPVAGGTSQSGSVRAFAAYSATASPYATRIADRDARARLAVSLADQIAARLEASAGEWAT